MKKSEKWTLKELEIAVSIIDDQRSITGGSGGSESPVIGGGLGSNIIPFSSVLAAQQAALNLSCETGLECGGLGFANGTAVLFQSPNATASTNVPLLPTNDYCVNGEVVSLYNGNVIQSDFHTHPDLPYASGVDASIQSTYYPNCDMTILQGNNKTTYHYEGGFLVP